MALTHKSVNTSFFQGMGISDIAAKYKVPVTTVENAIRLQLRRDIYVAPVQHKLLKDEQITISEIYGEITV